MGLFDFFRKKARPHSEEQMTEKEKAVYLNDKGKIVPKRQATRIIITEYDETGNRTGETYMRKETWRSRLADKKAAKALDNIVVDPESPLFKNATWYKNGEPVPYSELQRETEKSK